MIYDYFKVGISNLIHRKMRSWLTMVGIFIGIAAVVGLISLGQGMEEAIKNIFFQIGSDKLLVTAKTGQRFSGPPGSSAAANLTTHDMAAIKRVNGVDKVGGRLIKSAKLEFNREVRFYFVASMPDDQEGRELVTAANRYEAESGRLLKRGDRFKAVIGHDVANKGIFKTKRIELGNKIKISDVDFEAVGILKKSGNPQQDRVIIIPEDALREVLGIDEDALDVIAVQAAKGVDINQASQNIERELRRERDVEEGKEDFEIQTPQQILETLGNILTMVKIVLIGIASISLLVGGIGIANTMYTAVLERTKEIGIMKSVGAQNKDILIIFLIESGLLGLTGGAIGVGIGMGLSKLVEIAATNFLGTSLIKAFFPWYLILGALTFSFLIGAISGLLPARQAALLKPVDALRYE
ncbi:ABC transporter permease [Candidatus Woesearchaeota archaeon]|nr:ABC transporter permease [Candidatus Woesearchaeota archaeon]MBI2130906.1 ABC transporter permease [Candidatus Woesearchaeota archaeon]MBI2660924.1 ABC transporter permease [Candidatus Woesearchaeota archaeon]